jgi:hypothetical protein
MQRNRFAQGVMKKFEYRLQAARARKYRSAQQFAEKMGFDPHAYRKYERGETQSSPRYALPHLCGTRLASAEQRAAFNRHCLGLPGMHTVLAVAGGSLHALSHRGLDGGCCYPVVAHPAPFH